jgi:fucose permease
MQEGGAQAHIKERTIIAVFFFLSGLLSASWSCRIPDVQVQLGLNAAQLGRVLFALPAGLVTGMAFASWLIAGNGVYRMTIISCISLCVFLVATGLSFTVLQLAVALFLLGVSRTIFNISINTGALVAQRHFPKPFVSTLHGIWSLACLVAAGIGALFLSAGQGPFIHFLVVALTVALVSLRLYSMLPPTTGSAEKRPFFVLPDKELLLLGAIAFCAMLAEGAVFDWSVLYFRDAVRAPRSWTITGYAAFITTMTLGRLFGDRLLARFGAYRMLLINAVIMTTGFAVVSLFPSFFAATLGFLLIGTGDSILVPVIYMLAGRSEKMPPSYALASVTLLGYMGFLLGPPMIGSIAKRLGLQASFGTITAASFLMLLLILVSRRRERAKKSPL